MSTRTRSIFLKILIVLTSIVLFGFQNRPIDGDPGLAETNGSIPTGYVELLVYGQASNPPLNYSWKPVQFFLPLTVGQKGSNFQGGAMTYAEGYTRLGPIVQFAGWPVHWNIRGYITPPPDCAIKITIDETWFNGYNTACEPLGVVGCITETWPADFIPGVEFTIPFDRAWGEPVPSIGTMGMPIHITVIVTSMAYGSDLSGGIKPLGCESNLWFPVIPQSPE